MFSTGDRLILIKHVLSTIPLHSFAILEPPKGILNQLEKIMSAFFWGEVDGLDKQHSKLCKPTQESGLGLRQLHDILQAFGCKLWWKMRVT